ncbi:MAG: PKD domain-containing protein [Bacteroidales bacterium]
MKKGLYLVYFGVILLTRSLSGQDCTIISKANDITPDRLCSPVTVDWEASFRGVNDAGTKVEILYEWDDGAVDIVEAVNLWPDSIVSEWAATATHIYTSDEDKCNYHPIATLIVNGQLCTSSSQEQIVTVWDNDDNNGGELLIDPIVYPICFGESANARFQDNTQFNCVPPQENDVPNLSTRWIQWIYGTDITMTGTPVTINGSPQTFPYYGNVITLPGPVTGSGIFSEVMNVADDKPIGQYFELTLRYWNYCNPYDDPLIPGPPADPVNGDNDPVITTAMILIVPFPDATIDPVDPVCITDGNFNLTAADGGGSWSGPGITNASNGRFNPIDAGVGDHVIRYEITDGNNCSDWDTVVVSVMPGPDATINPVSPLCDYADSFYMQSVTNDGTWSGDGIIDTEDGLFDPEVAGVGTHLISFETEPDMNGCVGKDDVFVIVKGPPDAWFLTEDSSWCENEPGANAALIEIDGTLDTNHELIWQINGSPDTIFDIDNDTIEAFLPAQPGNNVYRLRKVIEHFGDISCERSIDDELMMKIYPGPEMKLDIEPDGYCSPVSAEIIGSKGSKFVYTWDFGDGSTQITDSSTVFHSFFNTGYSDTIYDVSLTIETQHGCIDSIRKTIPVYPNPIADFFVSPITQDFPNTVVELLNYSSKGEWNYLWQFGDGTTDTRKQPMEHDYGTYGEYRIGLKTYSEYCADSIFKRIHILPPPPVAKFIPDTAGCGPLTVEFDNQSEYAETYLWDFDDGTYSNQENPVHTFLLRRQHTVRLTVSGPKGVSEATKVITVYPDPRADFDAFPRKGDRIDQVFRFVNSSTGATRYEWEFGDGNSSTDLNPSHVYGAEGMFDISLYAWNEYECPDTITLERFIEVTQSEGDLIFPNAFRWNGSGPTGGYWSEGKIDNSVFHPHFENVATYSLAIYSRWGELIYESDDLYKGWDGYTKDGDLSPQGVYVFKAWVEFLDGRKEFVVGDVTFLH